MSSHHPNSRNTETLPIREIPGSYGLPILGPILDRLNYFYFQGEEAYFHTRVRKYNSTVFRANMPPGPFISSSSAVVVLLDAASFPVLLDPSKVEKRDVLTGTYMPSTSFTGRHRMLAYLDPSEPAHAALKQLLFSLLASRRHRFIPEFRRSFEPLFSALEAEIARNGESNFNALNDSASFDFVARALVGVGTSGAGRDYPKLAAKWLLPQVCPVKSTGFLPWWVEELLLHAFPIPAFLVKNDYRKLYDFFYSGGGEFLDAAEKMGIPREEACHQLVFIAVFNAYGGFKLALPLLVKWVGSAGAELHRQLAEEVRAAVRSAGGEVTPAAVESMALVKSVVYEALRMEPPIPYQYGRAKEDMVVESHEAAFRIKKGEMVFGFQPMATRDPKVLERAEEFVGDRFVGQEGEKLLKYVLWSNGFETEESRVGNKQCGGKEVVVLALRLLVVELFLRYDSLTVGEGKTVEGKVTVVKSVSKAKY
ncbi:hypothetical protein ACLOJK_002946 [Asimina triloba]